MRKGAEGNDGRRGPRLICVEGFLGTPHTFVNKTGDLFGTEHKLHIVKGPNMNLFNSRLLLMLAALSIYVPQLAGAQIPGESSFVDMDILGARLGFDEAAPEFGAFYAGIGPGAGLTAVSVGSSSPQGSGGLFGKTQDKLKIGARYGIFAANGEPANDMPFYGVYGSYLLSPDWYLGVGVDSFEFDFERPYRVLGLQSPIEKDAPVSNTVISAWIEREFGQDSKAWKSFALAGIGFGMTDVDDLQGDVSGGGTYNITTDGGTEIIPFIGAGLRHIVTKRLEVEIAARADYHIGGWDVKDRNSGLTASVDDYMAYGAYVGLAYRF